MAQNGNGHKADTSKATWTVKSGLAQMLKGGVIMDVVTAEHARIAEEAGAVAVMALERVPADIRAMGGVARMSDPQQGRGRHRQHRRGRPSPARDHVTDHRARRSRRRRARSEGARISRSARA